MSTLPALNAISTAVNQGVLKQAFEDFLAGVKQIPGSGVAETTLTLASDAVTPSGGSGGIFTIDTEAAAASDNLATITMTNFPDGSCLIIRPASSARLVVVKHAGGGSGQILLRTAGDFTLGDTTHWLCLKRTGTSWQELWRLPSPAAVAIDTKTTTYALTAADCGKVIDATTGTWTLTLLALASAGVGFPVTVRNSGTGVITLDGNASETIDGATTLTLNPGDAISLSSEVGGWKSVVRTLGAGADIQGGIINGTLTASVSGNILTFALKTKSGGDPSASDSVYVIFRHGTITNGGYNVRRVTAALSWSLSAGSTVGFTSSMTGRIYAGLLDNSGTVEGFAYHPLSGLSLKAIDESALLSTTAEGGAGAADSAQVLYSTTARTGVPVRLLGYVEIQTGATAGNWSNSPTKIQTLGPGLPRTGTIMQPASASDSATATGATAMPFDNTIPQNTEGDQYLSLTLTPSSALNLLDIEHSGQYEAVGGAAFISVALYQDSTANALAAEAMHHTANAANYRHTLIHRMLAGTASSTTLKIRAGANANSVRFNGASGAGLFGGVGYSWLKATEIFA